MTTDTHLIIKASLYRRQQTPAGAQLSFDLWSDFSLFCVFVLVPRTLENVVPASVRVSLVFCDCIDWYGNDTGDGAGLGYDAYI